MQLEFSKFNRLFRCKKTCDEITNKTGPKTTITFSNKYKNFERMLYQINALKADSNFMFRYNRIKLVESTRILSKFSNKIEPRDQEFCKLVHF